MCQKPRECIQGSLITPRLAWFVMKHLTFGAVERDPKNLYFFVISTPFYEGILQKWLSGKISGAFFGVFFAILARRVGCMTKPF